MPVVTRSMDRKAGNAVVRRAVQHGLVPTFQHGLPLRQQTLKTQWALHVLAVTKGDVHAARHILQQTEDLFPPVQSDLAM